MPDLPRDPGAGADGDGFPGDGAADARGSVPVVPLVVGGSVLVVVFLALAMIIGLRGGASRGDADGLAGDVSIATTVVLSSRPPERAYDHLSEACREEIPFSVFEGLVSSTRERLASDLGVDLGRLAVADVETRSVVDDRSGEARVTLQEIGSDEIPVGDPFLATGWSSWVYENGLWRATDCTAPLAL